jgi:signal transduction histidine kinase
MYAGRGGGSYRGVVKIAAPGARWPADALVVAAVTVLTGMDAWWNQPGTREADALTYLLVAVPAAALLARRRWPVPVALLCGAALTAFYLLGHRGELLNLPSMVALYTVAVSGDRRRSLLAGAVAVPWSAALGWFAAEPPSAPAAEMLWPVAAVLLGEVVRGRRELRSEYAAQQARAVAEREREAVRRVAQERLRIARDVHDVVAHTMAAVNVQMGVAAAALDRRPDAARAALDQARASSREALRELRASVAVLREAGVGTPAGPAPGLAELDRLAARAAAAGLRVTLRRETGDRQLPAVVELTAYRIIQEALTNVIRHAGAGAATVSVTGTAGALLVEVTDDGAGAAAGTRPGARGYGLLGMAERAAALGGRVEHGPLPGGGFRVAAVLPLPQERPVPRPERS